MLIKNIQNNPSQEKGTVLVFGATGKQGGAVAYALKAQGWSVRVLVRNPESDVAKSLASEGMEVFRGDFSDAASLRAAMAEVEGVFSIQPNSGSAGSGVTDADEVCFGKRVADIAVESGVQHLVYTSASIISRGKTGLRNLDTKIEIEEYIRGLEIKSTIVRPGTFMELLTLPGMGLDQGSFSFFIHPDQFIQFIAVEDIGKIVAIVFGDIDRFAGRTIEIAGDEVNGHNLQTALTEASGRPIVYSRFPDSLLEGNVFLGRTAKLFDEGRATANADIAALKGEFGDLLNLREWLAGPGKVPLQAAVKANNQSLSLR